MLIEEIKKQDISAISLILVNIIPAIGVLFFNWSLFSILILFWFETAIICFYAILKLIIAPFEFMANNPSEKPIIMKKYRHLKISDRIISKLVIMPFFIFLYGIFMFIHLKLIFGLLYITSHSIGFSMGTPIIINELYKNIIPLALFFISHGISFYFNFIKLEEYKNFNLDKIVSKFENRLSLMHFTILLGGFVILFTGIPTMMIVFFILLKIIFDLRAHNREHRTENFLTPKKQKRS